MQLSIGALRAANRRAWRCRFANSNRPIFYHIPDINVNILYMLTNMAGRYVGDSVIAWHRVPVASSH